MVHKKTHFRSPLVLSVASWRMSLIDTSLSSNFSELGAPFLSEEQSLGYNLIKWSFESIFTVTLFILRNSNISFMAVIWSFLLKLLLVEQCFQEKNQAQTLPHSQRFTLTCADEWECSISWGAVKSLPYPHIGGGCGSEKEWGGSLSVDRSPRRVVKWPNYNTEGMTCHRLWKTRWKEHTYTHPWKYIVDG